jgi:hypothetical protein
LIDHGSDDSGNDGDIWKMNSLNPSLNGCYYESYDLVVEKPPYHPGVYSTNLTNDGSKIVFEIRHVDDPYVLASRLTKGTYKFGLSSPQNAVMGIILLVIGGVLCAALVGAYIVAVKCFYMILFPTQKDNNNQGGVIPAVSTMVTPPTPDVGSSAYVSYLNHNQMTSHPQQYPIPSQAFTPSAPPHPVMYPSDSPYNIQPPPYQTSEHMTLSMPEPKRS